MPPRYSTRIARPFPPGTRVEISPKDAGFVGSWYTGTVVQGNRNKCLVQYETLVSDVDPSEPVRETLEVSQLRPVPPPETRKEFQVGDKVDAYYNEGWWEGMVMKALGRGRLEVFFRPSGEHMRFKKKELRLHRNWVHGKWIPPFDGDERIKPVEAKTIHEIYSKGTRVEVNSDEDGFLGAWFASTIVEVVRNDKFIVQYQSLRTDDDSEFLREEIDIHHIRPCPPQSLVIDRFNLSEEVDASYNDGWWVGVISKVLVGSKYRVYFRDTDEEIEFHHNDLRPHQEWIDGKWVMASKALKL